MILGADADIRLVLKEHPVIVLLVKDPLDNDEVQFAMIEQLQQMLGVVHEVVDLIFRRLQVFFNVWQQHILPDGFRSPDAKRCLGIVVKALEKIVLIVAKRLRILLHQLPLSRLAQTPVGICEQRHAVLVFERLNVLADRRLRQIQQLRRAAVVHGAAKRQKGFQSLFHGLSPTRS